MSQIISAIPELWTDQIIDLGASSRDIHQHIKVLFQDGTTEWHYYGTELPLKEDRQAGIEYFSHPAVHFPQDIFNLETQSDVLYSMAFDVITRLLQL